MNPFRLHLPLLTPGDRDSRESRQTRGRSAVATTELVLARCASVVVPLCRVGAALALGFLLATASVCTAQTGEACHFRLISWSAVMSDLKFLNGDGTAAPVEIPLNRFSPVYDYKGPGPIVFGTGTRGGAGNVGFKQLAMVPVREPESGGTLWILFTGTDAVGQYQSSSIEEKENDLQPGGYRFLNFSDYPLHIKCGNWEMIAPPRKSASFRPNTTDSVEIMPVELTAERDGGLKRVYANRWPYGKTTQTLVVAYFDPATQRYELKRITSEAPSPTPEKLNKPGRPQ